MSRRRHNSSDGFFNNGSLRAPTGNSSTCCYYLGALLHEGKCEWSLLFIFVFKLLSKNKKVAERWFKAFHIMQHILTWVLSAVFLLCFPSDFMQMYWDVCFSHFCTHQIPGWSGPLQFVIQYKRLKNEQYNNRILYCTDMMYFLSGMKNAWHIHTFFRYHTVPIKCIATLYKQLTYNLV